MKQSFYFSISTTGICESLARMSWENILRTVLYSFFLLVWILRALGLTLAGLWNSFSFGFC